MKYTRTACVALAAALLSACENTAEVAPVTDPTGGAIFRSYVALGNSITAGWQSGGINDSTQRQSYPFLLAQKMGTDFAYPAFAAFGCPPPVGNFVTQKKIDSLVPAAQQQPCYLRSTASISPIINNVAVPLAYARDLLGPSATDATIPTIPGNALWTLILGGRSQVEKAFEADVTFATVWSGNNETLLPATVGMLQPPAGTAPPAIPPNLWIPGFKAAMDSLDRAPNLQGGVLIGAVDVTNVPRFFSADSLAANATFKAQFETLVGKPVQLIGCGASGAFVSIEIAKRIQAWSPTNPTNPATHPPIISCVKNTPQPPLGDIFILDATERATFSGITAQYNAYIKAKADTMGFAYLDPNPLLAQLRTTGAIPAKPNFLSPTQPFGTYFSLDGAHPSGAAHVLIANALADAINKKYGTTLPTQ
jgi:hypothetical protein